MKNIVFTILLFGSLFINITAQANTEQSILNEKLFSSVVNNDFEKFQLALKHGADANAMTDGSYYRSSALCEATKPGNEPYLDAIIDATLVMPFIHSMVPGSSQATCAVAYRNIKAFNKLLAIGLDVSIVLNPGSPVQLHNTILDVALSIFNMEVVWIVMNIHEPNDGQIARMVDRIERSSAIIGHPKVEAIDNIVGWLRERNIEVNPRPARALEQP